MFIGILFSGISLISHYFCYLLSLSSLFLICSFLSSDLNTILLPHITLEETLIWGFFFFFKFFFLLWCCDSRQLWVDQRWRKRWSSGGSGSVDLAAVAFGFWSRLIWFFFFFWWCCDSRRWWVDQWWRKRWSSGGGSGVDLTATVSGFWSGLIWVFLFLIWVFVLVEFWWVVVAWWAWWRCGGGD